MFSTYVQVSCVIQYNLKAKLLPINMSLWVYTVHSLEQCQGLRRVLWKTKCHVHFQDDTEEVSMEPGELYEQNIALRKEVDVWRNGKRNADSRVGY